MARPLIGDWHREALPYVPQPFQYGRLRGAAHPALVNFFRNLPRIDTLPVSSDTAVYMQHPNLVREVGLPASLGAPWTRLVVKQFGWRGQQHYIFSPLKRSRAMKAYSTACHLLSHHLHTPLPLGVFEERHWGFVKYNVLATEAILDYVTLRQYRESLPESPEEIEDVLKLAADYTRRVHDCGIWHRDMVLSNFLMTGLPGQRRLYLIDLNRAYRLPAVPMWLRAFDIARMDWLAWHRRFVVLYCADRYPVALIQAIVAGYSYWRWLRQWTRPVRRWLKRAVGIAS
ncbi:MAG: hypothetical protein ETSY1_38905 [Candidatus Entotheonella factor]|uniref:Protein kinase domain-containing protein n=1 Tax=Entotheonella factor TaxID=1429438 RepID=W4L618_ENTF1|nr:lipopolysaccharide kinase InaA family protein [Candidatus Entotheonella palauensis]ETW93502.1 MAG: hypothetical protein ETSY1_38905 [Candidatus Entotheonella factor]